MKIIMWRFTSTTFNFLSIYLIVNQIISEARCSPVVNRTNGSFRCFDDSTFFKNIFLESYFLKRLLTSIYFTPIKIKLATIWSKQVILKNITATIYQKYTLLSHWFISCEDYFYYCPQSLKASIEKQICSTG